MCEKIEPSKLGIRLVFKDHVRSEFSDPNQISHCACPGASFSKRIHERVRDSAFPVLRARRRRSQRATRGGSFKGGITGLGDQHNPGSSSGTEATGIRMAWSPSENYSQAGNTVPATQQPASCCPVVLLRWAIGFVWRLLLCCPYHSRSCWGQMQKQPNADPMGRRNSTTQRFSMSAPLERPQPANLPGTWPLYSPHICVLSSLQDLPISFHIRGSRAITRKEGPLAQPFCFTTW